MRYLLLVVLLVSFSALRSQTGGNATNITYTITTSREGDTLSYRFEEDRTTISKIFNTDQFSIKDIPGGDILSKLNPTQLINKFSDKINQLQEKLDAINLINQIVGDITCPHTVKVTVKKKEKEENDNAEEEKPTTVKCDEIKLQCFPNPSNGTFQLNITSQNELPNVPIYFSHPDGKVISIRNVISSPYTETVLYNVSGLSKGHYILSTPCQNTSTSVTITIQ